MNLLLLYMYAEGEAAEAPPAPATGGFMFLLEQFDKQVRAAVVIQVSQYQAIHRQYTVTQQYMRM
jgi:hypothetical protein